MFSYDLEHVNFQVEYDEEMHFLGVYLVTLVGKLKLRGVVTG